MDKRISDSESENDDDFFKRMKGYINKNDKDNDSGIKIFEHSFFFNKLCFSYTICFRI